MWVRHLNICMNICAHEYYPISNEGNPAISAVWIEADMIMFIEISLVPKTGIVAPVRLRAGLVNRTVLTQCRRKVNDKWVPNCKREYVLVWYCKVGWLPTNNKLEEKVWKIFHKEMISDLIWAWYNTYMYWSAAWSPIKTHNCYSCINIITFVH